MGIPVDKPVDKCMCGVSVAFIYTDVAFIAEG